VTGAGLLYEPSLFLLAECFFMIQRDSIMLSSVHGGGCTSHPVPNPLLSPSVPFLRSQ
jgi:hypothetical protein